MKATDQPTEIAHVNDIEEAKRFFDEYNIPYAIIPEGENKGKLLIRPIRREDHHALYEAEKRLEKSRLRIVTDHGNVFRDKDDNAIATFSPYNISELPKNRPWLEMSDCSIYGNGTRTFVVRSNALEAEKQKKQEKKDLEYRIDQAEKRLLRAKAQYDQAIETFSKLLDKRDEIRRGLDGGKVSLKQWEYTWNGSAAWTDGSGSVRCNYQARMSFKTKGEVPTGPEIRTLEMNSPGFTKKDVLKALQDSLQNTLDDEFEEYCNEDDYYQPVAEDFEAEYIAREWAEKRGLELTQFSGTGDDEGYEPGRRRW